MQAPAADADGQGTPAEGSPAEAPPQNSFGKSPKPAVLASSCVNYLQGAPERRKLALAAKAEVQKRAAEQAAEQAKHNASRDDAFGELLKTQAQAQRDTAQILAESNKAAQQTSANQTTALMQMMQSNQAAQAQQAQVMQQMMATLAGAFANQNK